MTEAIARPSARVLVVDESDRLLMLSGFDAEQDVTRWYVVGGGVQPGETHVEAALRDVREETGLSGVTLGPEVWSGRPWVAVWDGVTDEVRQRYFLLRTPAFDIDTSGFEAYERSQVTGHRWWTVEGLQATDDLLRPDGLAELYAHLLTDGPPEQPLEVSG